MITLHGFGKKLGLLDPSPFVMKVDAYLSMAEIDFKRDRHPNNLRTAKKGKLPFIVDDDETIVDSQFIIEHLIAKYGDKLDHHLTKEQKAIAYLITKSLDENLYFCIVYSRWIREDNWNTLKKVFFGKLPIILRSILPLIIRRSLVKILKGQGILLHSDTEILHITRSSLQALSDLLGEQDYFFGEKPSTLDATCYGMLAALILVELDNPYNSLAREFNNLVNYCERIRKEYYS